MSAVFSSNLLLLRHNAGLSQKQAAHDLGISQALLSHYEKGIRECSLDFVVKAAQYYDVTSDYMLGITASEKSGAITDESPLPSDKHAQPLTILRSLVKLAGAAESTDDEHENLFTDFFSVCIKNYLAILDNDNKNTSGLCNLVLSAFSDYTFGTQNDINDGEPAECITAVTTRADILIKRYLDGAI